MTQVFLKLKLNLTWPSWLQQQPWKGAVQVPVIDLTKRSDAMTQGQRKGSRTRSQPGNGTQVGAGLAQERWDQVKLSETAGKSVTLTGYSQAPAQARCVSINRNRKVTPGVSEQIWTKPRKEKCRTWADLPHGCDCSGSGLYSGFWGHRASPYSLPWPL